MLLPSDPFPNPAQNTLILVNLTRTTETRFPNKINHYIMTVVCFRRILYQLHKAQKIKGNHRPMDTNGKGPSKGLSLNWNLLPTEVSHEKNAHLIPRQECGIVFHFKSANNFNTLKENLKENVFQNIQQEQEDISSIKILHHLTPSSWPYIP